AIVANEQPVTPVSGFLATLGDFQHGTDGANFDEIASLELPYLNDGDDDVVLGHPYTILESLPRIESNNNAIADRARRLVQNGYDLLLGPGTVALDLVLLAQLLRLGGRVRRVDGKFFMLDGPR